MPSFHREMSSVPPPWIFWPWLILSIILATVVALVPPLLPQIGMPDTGITAFGFFSYLVSATLAALLVGVPAKTMINERIFIL